MGLGWRLAVKYVRVWCSCVRAFEELKKKTNDFSMIRWNKDLVTMAEKHEEAEAPHLSRLRRIAYEIKENKDLVTMAEKHEEAEAKHLSRLRRIAYEIKEVRAKDESLRAEMQTCFRSEEERLQELNERLQAERTRLKAEIVQARAEDDRLRAELANLRAKRMQVFHGAAGAGAGGGAGAGSAAAACSRRSRSEPRALLNVLKRKKPM
jgi:DNA repair exonuclease SbcCD ATPase subunit